MGAKIFGADTTHKLKPDCRRRGSLVKETKLVYAIFLGCIREGKLTCFIAVSDGFAKMGNLNSEREAII